MSSTKTTVNFEFVVSYKVGSYLGTMKKCSQSDNLVSVLRKRKFLLFCLLLTNSYDYHDSGITDLGTEYGMLVPIRLFGLF